MSAHPLPVDDAAPAAVEPLTSEPRSCEAGEDDVLAATPPGTWRLRARCRGVPTAVFFPTAGDGIEAAQRVCRHCPVHADCRRYALSIPWLKGVWGGLSEEGRRRARSQQRRAAAFDCEPSVEVASLRQALELLVPRPREWARVAVYPASGSASGVAKRLSRRWLTAPDPRGAWLFRTASLPDGGSELWAVFEPAGGANGDVP